MSRFRLLAAIPLLAVALLSGCATFIAKERVTFRSDDLTLVGYLFKPHGPGPFPAVIWNHGSERSPGQGRQFDSVAALFVPYGYVVFAPVRRGHDHSEGVYIVDQIARTRAPSRGPPAHRLSLRLLAP